MQGLEDLFEDLRDILTLNWLGWVGWIGWLGGWGVRRPSEWESPARLLLLSLLLDNELFRRPSRFLGDAGEKHM